MPEPRAMNIELFLEEVTAVNGPLMFIPQSHKDGTLEAGHDLATTSYPLWTLDRETVARLAEQGGIVAPTGPAGSVLLFHCNLVHASPPNISPWGRTIVRSEEHTSELQSLMRISYAVFCLKKKKQSHNTHTQKREHC